MEQTPSVQPTEEPVVAITPPVEAAKPPQEGGWNEEPVVAITPPVEAATPPLETSKKRPWWMSSRGNKSQTQNKS